MEDKKISEIENEEDEEEVISMEKWLKGRDLPEAHNKEELLHLRESKVGKTFITRFPPEPNGYLHIGHCKAMTFNFTLAESKGGRCILRFDDTNPEAEKQEYIDNIIENVRWMGFNPSNINFSSDYFDQLYELAIELIKKGYAYVCHQTKDQMEEERKSYKAKDPKPSPYRNTSVEENLRKFKLMKCGYYEEGKVCLRMKGDITSDNPNMWDQVAYRIKYTAHPHVGNKWCIYPTYDYTHCIIDSLEWISASCCTLEFENRRESYFWLLDVLNLYKPVVWEYSRLNLTHNVISKRKLLKLVNQKIVRGWDDPRMITIVGLRRRGYTSEILRNFVQRVGVTRKTNFISPKLLEAIAREVLNEQCKRTMAVIKPLKIIISNYHDHNNDEHHYGEIIECPNFPQNLNLGIHKVIFGQIIYNNENDFNINENANNSNFYGLTLNKTIRLKYAYNITCKDVVWKYDEKNNKIIDHLICEYDVSSRHDIKGVKKGHLSWVSAIRAIPCEFRLYNTLFNDPFPESDKFLEYLNPESEIVCHGYVDEFAVTCKDERYQFERLGYFVKDNKDYTHDKPVFNRIVTLNESTEKKHM